MDYTDEQRAVETDLYPEKRCGSEGEVSVIMMIMIMEVWLPTISSLLLSFSSLSTSLNTSADHNNYIILIYEDYTNLRRLALDELGILGISTIKAKKGQEWYQDQKQKGEYRQYVVV